MVIEEESNAVWMLKKAQKRRDHTMTKPNFVVITHPKSETLANCLSKQDKTFLSQVNKYLAGENRVTSA